MSTKTVSKQKGEGKILKRVIPIKTEEAPLRKPEWLKIRMPMDTESNASIARIKKALRNNNLHTICEEGACPNLAECFSGGTATFLIMGDICTRRCSFCDVAHGRPGPLDTEEPIKLAKTIAEMGLNYVVITSVDRDDLRDGGAQHYSDCLREIRKQSPNITIEVLVPDFRGRMDRALDAIATEIPDVFNHNIETVPRLYKPVRPGSDYQWSLTLLQRFKAMFPQIPTKSGIMLGLGETLDEVVDTLQDLRNHDVEMVTIGQYLQPSKHHHPVMRFVPPSEFDELRERALNMGFTQVASGPFVRSSYHADRQARGEIVA